MIGHGHATEHRINEVCGCCRRRTISPGWDSVCPDCHRGVCQQPGADAGSAEQPPAVAPPVAPDPEDAVRRNSVREARATLAATRAALCPCGSGVLPKDCIKCRPRPLPDPTSPEETTP